MSHGLSKSLVLKLAVNKPWHCPRLFHLPVQTSSHLHFLYMREPAPILELDARKFMEVRKQNICKASKLKTSYSWGITANAKVLWNWFSNIFIVDFNIHRDKLQGFWKKKTRKTFESENWQKHTMQTAILYKVTSCPK